MSVVTGKEDVPLGFLWLEITGRCQLECVHCYAASGPGRSHGIMTEWDWCRVIDQAAALGVRMVQFIGGEPTLHPGLPALMERALAGGMTVEVYTNLVGVGRRLWGCWSDPGCGWPPPTTRPGRRRTRLSPAGGGAMSGR
jgi:molybdenum cofactor biosynthesis enzyme MoaA